MFSYLISLFLLINIYYINCYENDWWPQKSTESPVELGCGVGITPFDVNFNETRDAKEGEIAWQVSVQKKIDGKWAHHCGGVVINKNFVLTNAQCVDGSEAFCRSEAGIIALPKGGWTRRRRQSIPDISYPGQQTPGLQYSQRITIHPEFDEKTLENNLAIIYLAQPFDINKAMGKINRICLPTEPISQDNQLYVSGWGSLGESSELRPTLQVTKANSIACNSDEKDKTALCLSQEVSNQNVTVVCEGDLGGPVFSYNGTNSILMGIYSSGNNCINAEPARVIKIESYIDWIENNTKPLYDTQK